MPINPNLPLELLTAEYPGTRRLMGRLGVDFLTEGQLTLAEAAQRHGLALDEVVTDLERGATVEASPRDWLMVSKKVLISHIVTHHHGFAREEMTRLAPLFKQAIKENGGSRNELAQVRIHFQSLERDLLAHFQMEERNLFPAICALDNGGPTPISLSTPKEQLRTIHAEHQAVEELFLNIRMLTSDYALPPDASTSLRALYLGLRDLEDDLHIHLYLENHLLFPRVLPGESW